MKYTDSKFLQIPILDRQCRSAIAHWSKYQRGKKKAKLTCIDVSKGCEEIIKLQLVAACEMRLKSSLLLGVTRAYLWKCEKYLRMEANFTLREKFQQQKPVEIVSRKNARKEVIDMQGSREHFNLFDFTNGDLEESYKLFASKADGEKGVQISRFLGSNLYSSDSEAAARFISRHQPRDKKSLLLDSEKHSNSFGAMLSRNFAAIDMDEALDDFGGSFEAKVFSQRVSSINPSEEKAIDDEYFLVDDNYGDEDGVQPTGDCNELLVENRSSLSDVERGIPLLSEKEQPPKAVTSRRRKITPDANDGKIPGKVFKAQLQNIAIHTRSQREFLPIYVPASFTKLNWRNIERYSTFSHGSRHSYSTKLFVKSMESVVSMSQRGAPPMIVRGNAEKIESKSFSSPEVGRGIPRDSHVDDFDQDFADERQHFEDDELEYGGEDSERIVIGAAGSDKFQEISSQNETQNGNTIPLPSMPSIVLANLVGEGMTEKEEIAFTCSTDTSRIAAARYFFALLDLASVDHGAAVILTQKKAWGPIKVKRISSA